MVDLVFAHVFTLLFDVLARWLLEDVEEIATEQGNDILPGVNAGVSSRWGYRLPTHGGNLRVRMLLVGTVRAW